MENCHVCSVQYCVQQLCTVQYTHKNRPNSCLLVTFRFPVLKLCVTVFFWLSGIILCYHLFVYVCFSCVRFSFFNTVPRDWLGRVSLK